jgi:hypothetical protein
MLRDGLRLEENEPSPDTLPLCDGTIGDGIIGDGIFGDGIFGDGIIFSDMRE